MVIAFDPPSRKSKFKSPYFQTGIVLVSHEHEHHNGKDVLHGKGDTPPFVIDGPGEYEHQGITVIGIPSFHDSQKGKKQGLNTVYQVTMEDLTLLHLGDFGEAELRPELKERIGGTIDVLFLPIGGGTVMDPETAASIAGKIEPKIIIPTHYEGETEKKKSALAEFLDEIGAAGTKAEQKFTFKKRDLPTEDTRVVVLEANI